MEAAVTNFVDPGAKLAIFVNGFFCERIAEMGRRHGANVVCAEKPWGEVFTEAEARAFLEKERPQVVAFVHGETSTGAMQAPEAITRPAHEVGALVIADCVTKGLSAPPGLSPFTVSPRAVERLKARTAPNSIWYLDLKLLMDYYDGKKYHHTAPVSTFYALREALAAIQEEGVEQRFARHLNAHRSFVKRIEAMGLKMHVAEGKRLTTLNTPRVPEGVDEAWVRKQLLDEFGIEVAGGFGPLAGKIFRIGVMGPLAVDASLDVFFEAFGTCIAAAQATVAG